MNHKVEAERFYIPWLYDLAVLEKRLLPGFSFRPSYAVTFPYADRSDYYVDYIPNPDFVFLLIYTHSYLEKGLKYLCLINDPGTSYSHVASHGHNLQKTWQQLQQVPTAASLERVLRDHALWELFNALSSLNHPGLRYLHVEKEHTVDVRKLSSLVTVFKEFLLLQRRDVVFADPVVFGELKASPPCIRASIPVSTLPTGSQRVDWVEWTLSIEPQGG